jgi:hypothetical protein
MCTKTCGRQNKAAQGQPRLQGLRAPGDVLNDVNVHVQREAKGPLTTSQSRRTHSKPTSKKGTWKRITGRYCTLSVGFNSIETSALQGSGHSDNDPHCRVPSLVSRTAGFVEWSEVHETRHECRRFDMPANPRSRCAYYHDSDSHMITFASDTECRIQGITGKKAERRGAGVLDMKGENRHMFPASNRRIE